MILSTRTRGALVAAVPAAAPGFLYDADEMFKSNVLVHWIYKFNV